MVEDSQPHLKTEDFVGINWVYNSSEKNHYGYSSVMSSLEKMAKAKEKANEVGQAEVLTLLARASSMMLEPTSINEPFKPMIQDFQQGRRSAIPEDFTGEELFFFTEILELINEPWLRSRISDLLWLCLKPKNADHARIAIDTYTTHDIKPSTWKADVDDCWNRAIRLCLQIKDFDRLEVIKERLVKAFNGEYTDSPFMHLWLAKLLGEHNLDKGILSDVSEKLASIGKSMMESNDFIGSRSYLDFSATKYQQNNDEERWLECLVTSADSYDKEADSRVTESQMVANSLYENAVQSYRKIPIKHRPKFGIEERIRNIRAKITETGKEALGEMGIIRSPGIDISEMAKASIEHVSNKNSIENALIYFSGLFSGPDYDELTESAKSILKESFLSSIFAATHYGSDGRVVAKRSGANFNAGEDDPDNQAIVHNQIMQNFAFEYQLVVKGQILPALSQLLMEYRFTLPILESLCFHSPIVPSGREKLTAYALWMGFEHQFSNAIHLLSPQFEHCVRIKLKDAGSHTSNVDKDGIENENGLSTLMDLPEAIDVFGKNLVFEIKALFTDPIGPNLRNEVAHGLLDDNSAHSIGSVYAWWMILRLVVRSLAFPDENIEEDTEL